MAQKRARYLRGPVRAPEPPAQGARADERVQGIRRLDLELRAETSGARSFDVTASTEALDSHGTVLRGWDLDRYRRAPVVLWNHRRTGTAGEDLPIGHSENVRVEAGALRMRIRLVSAAAHPLADFVWNGIREGAIRGVSVGFGPTTRTTVREEMRDGVPIDVIEGLELLEVSLVPVGSNPEAVIEGVRALRDDVRRVAPRPRLPYTPETVRAYLEVVRACGASEAEARASAADTYGISALELERIEHADALEQTRRTAVAEWAIKAGLARTLEEGRRIADAASESRPRDPATENELRAWQRKTGLA